MKNCTSVNPGVSKWASALLWVLMASLASGCVMTPPQAKGGGGRRIIQNTQGESGATQMMEFKGANLTPAAELPTGEPDVAGLFQRRDDSSIFVGTGEVEMTAVIEKGSDQPILSATSNGPTVEVVVNRNTQIYKDITEISMEAERDGLDVQQVVEPYDSLDQLLEEVSNTDTLSIWGERSGDRVIATVIVFRPFTPMGIPAAKQ